MGKSQRRVKVKITKRGRTAIYQRALSDKAIDKGAQGKSKIRGSWVSERRERGVYLKTTDFRHDPPDLH